MSKKIMFLGTASSVGKSTIATAFCRYFKNKGLKVAPFKALNISLNSYVTFDGLEIGRAQAVQAEACEISATAVMNPILLKPIGNLKTQVIICGKVHSNIDSYKYAQLNKSLKKVAIRSFYDLEKDYDLIVLEGSGSCAEINLKESDIANISMAKEVNAPVILVADIDRGGVFASIVGTIMLLDDDERKLIKGIIINKFRGDVEYFKPAIKQLEEIIKIPVLGVMPYQKINIEEEDSVTEKIRNQIKNKDFLLDIAIIKLNHMSNFTDFNVLEMMPYTNVRYVSDVKNLKNPHIIIIPGTKNTISDLKFIKSSGIFDKIIKLKQKGTIIFGICGGYQMLGSIIEDNNNVETDGEKESGFGFLKIKTVFSKEKLTRQVEGKIYSDIFKSCHKLNVEGYEIHNGESIFLDDVITFIKNQEDNIIGLSSNDNKVFGTYMHGIFDNYQFSLNFTNEVKKLNNIPICNTKTIDYKKYKLNEYDKLCLLLEKNVNMSKVEEIIFSN